MRRVDGSQKGIILHFLKEAELIAGGESAIISLYWADLTDAYLHGADLRDLNLKRVDFFNADLSMADMRKQIYVRPKYQRIFKELT